MSGQERKVKGSDLFVAALESEGVDHIFGFPARKISTSSNCCGHSKIELVLTRHEQAAGFMAATYGRLTGGPASA